MKQGKYITLEGGEGVGKTTQVKRLVKRLATVGLRAQEVREPGGDEFAEALRTVLLSDIRRNPESEVLVFNAARTQTIQRVRKLLDKGQWAVVDRSSLSTLAYQSYGEGVDLQFTRLICDAVTHLCKPDLQILLVASAAELKKRREKRGIRDRFEQMNGAFHRRVNAGYVKEAARLKIPVVDGSGTPKEVEERIWEIVKKKFKV
jgi:dTMP kinase